MIGRRQVFRVRKCSALRNALGDATRAYRKISDQLKKKKVAMPRIFLTAVLVFGLTRPTLAVVESVDIKAALTSEKTTVALSECSPFNGSTIQGRIDLEDCGILIERDTSSVRGSSDKRSELRARTPYGFSRLIFNRRFSLPVSGMDGGSTGFGWRDGVGISTSIDLFGGDGAATVSTAITLVERLRPTVKPDFGPSILNLDVRAVGLENFSTANVKVFDHDTNELLLTWERDQEPLKPNNGIWFNQNLNFDDRLGHAIRYEFEAEGRIEDGVAHFAAVANLNVPEPSCSHIVAVPCLVCLVMRRKRTIM